MTMVIERQERMTNTNLMAPPGVLSLIGNTPVVEVTRIDTGPCRLFLKLENQNPGGSIKDRIAVSMIEAAEKSGQLKPGGVVVEATAGNTGLALALVARAKGYRIILVIPDKMSDEKVRHLKALGAEIKLTRSDVPKGHPEYYQEMAAAITKATPGAFYINQFGNPANPAAHEASTGPEILRQMNGDVDAVVVGVGSGGTLTGLKRYFAKASPKTEMVLADPEGSILADYIKTGKLGSAGSWVVEGIGEDFIPDIADLSGVKSAYTISDKESLLTAREVLAKELILGGSSSGTLVAAALRYCREQTTPKRVLTFICDTGTKYLSKMYNDTWMIEQGYIERTRYNNLRDLIGRRFEDGAVVSIGPNDTLMTAWQRMRIAGVAQLPVLEGDNILGLLDESDLLIQLYRKPENFKQPVSSAMMNKLETLAPSASLEQLKEVLDKGLTAIIAENKHFYGLITRYDLLSYLRRSMK
jgi:cystathionine beta-synthase